MGYENEKRIIRGLQRDVDVHTYVSLFYDKQQVSLAKEFEALVRSDNKFQVTNDVLMGLVCFRLKVRL